MFFHVERGMGAECEPVTYGILLRGGGKIRADPTHAALWLCRASAYISRRCQAQWAARPYRGF
jgi:hypothetical protein